MLDLALFSCAGSSEEQICEFAKKVQGYGCKNVLLTMGRGGQLLVTEEGLFCRGQAKLVEAVDTMGAGDSFFAAFLVKLLELGWRKQAPLREEQVREAFGAASEYAARVCLVEGSFGMGLEIEM